MKKKNFMKVLVIASLLILPFAMKGQSPPNLDGNWALNPSLSDEFQGYSLDLTKWDILDNSVPCDPVDGHDCWTYGRFVSYNVVPSGDLLLLKATDKLHTSGIKSKNSNYLYGYYELRAKLPGYLNPLTNQPCNRGFWTSFWAYYQVKTNNCIIAHNEIDINEISGLDGVDSDARTVNSHCWSYSGNCQADLYCDTLLHNLPPLYENFHKFGAEYLPDRIIFYFDDVPFNVYHGQVFNPAYAMRVVIDNQLRIESEINDNTPWPMNYTIDYFRYYQLKTNYCATDASIIDNTQLANFQFGVRRNITIGNGSSNVSLAIGVTNTFRATEGITINGNFTVPLGSVLYLIQTPCPL